MTQSQIAIELGISQAAVSRNLMALEQVLGVRLLHRTSRGIPRALNNLATQALIACYAKQNAIVDLDCAQAAVAEVTAE